MDKGKWSWLQQLHFPHVITCSVANMVIEIRVKICSSTALDTLSPTNYISESLCVLRGAQDSSMSKT